MSAWTWRRMTALAGAAALATSAGAQPETSVVDSDGRNVVILKMAAEGEGPSTQPADVEVEMQGLRRLLSHVQPPKPKDVTYLGVGTGPATAALQAQLGLPTGVGLTVTHVGPDSPAAKAGVQVHDVLHKLDDQLLVNADQLRTLVRARKAGDTTTLTVFRAGKPTPVVVELATHSVIEPDPGAGLWLGDGAPMGLNGPGRPGERRIMVFRNSDGDLLMPGKPGGRPGEAQRLLLRTLRDGPDGPPPPGHPGPPHPPGRPPEPGQAPGPRSGLPPLHRDRDAHAALLQVLTRVEAEDMPLDALLGQLAAVMPPPARLALDLESLSAVGVDEGSRVSLDVSDQTLADVLRLVGEQLSSPTGRVTYHVSGDDEVRVIGVRVD